MRHLKKGKRLNRDREHRKAMFSNMMVSLFQNGRIKTTSAKAKELKRLSERVITRAKENSLHNKRIVLRSLKNRDIVAKLFDSIAPKYRDVCGGYTRIIRLGKRMGDGADMSLVELVHLEDGEEKRSKTKKKEESKKEESKKEESKKEESKKEESKKEESKKKESKKKESKKKEESKKEG